MLKLEGVKQVWGRDGLLVPRHSNEPSMLHLGSQNIDREQVRLNAFHSWLCFNNAGV